MRKFEAVNLAGQSVVYDEEKLNTMLVAVTKAYGLVNRISPDDALPLNEVHHLLYALMHGKIKQGEL